MSINPRILGAFLIGAGLIAFAYFFAPTTNPTPITDTIDPLSVPAKRQFIAVGDSDNDGIPDWSESFRQAVVPVIEQETLEGDGAAYEPPETLTGQLAIDVFTQMIQSETRGPLGPSQADILNNADLQMQEAATDKLYTVAELTLTSDNSTSTLYEYGNQVAEILVTHMAYEGSRNEVEIVLHAVQTDKPEVLAELTPIIQAYEAIVRLLLTTPTPSSVAQDHLNMVNAFNALLIDTKGMEQAFTDPIYTIVRMQRYYDDAVGRNNTIVNVYNNLIDQGVVWSQEDVVAELISF